MPLKNIYKIDVESEPLEISRIYENKMKEFVQKIIFPFTKKVKEKCLEEEKGKFEIDFEDLKEEILQIINCEHEKKLYEEYLEKEKIKEKSSAENELEQLELEMAEKVELDKEKSDSTNQDKIFELFQLICQRNPKQILRYTRHYSEIEPLWYQEKGIKQIYEKYELKLNGKTNKKCKHCGGNLIFEMQIMPQLFNYIEKFISVDWGTILVYTCEKSCESKDKFCEEVGIIQYID